MQPLLHFRTLRKMSELHARRERSDLFSLACRRVIGGPAHEPWPLQALWKPFFGEFKTCFTVLITMSLYVSLTHLTC